LQCLNNRNLLFELYGAFVYWKVISGKSLFKLFYICLLLEKLVNRKYFIVKGKFGLVFRKVFSFYFEWKTLFGSCEKFRNVILFADYIKFGPQTFDCYIYIYIYFVLNIYFFNFILEKLIFILTLIFIFIIVIFFSLIIF